MCYKTRVNKSTPGVKCKPYMMVVRSRITKTTAASDLKYEIWFAIKLKLLNLHDNRFVGVASRLVL